MTALKSLLFGLAVAIGALIPVAYAFLLWGWLRRSQYPPSRAAQFVVYRFDLRYLTVLCTIEAAIFTVSTIAWYRYSSRRRR